jgi:hypothetical protein
LFFFLFYLVIYFLEVLESERRASHLLRSTT